MRDYRERKKLENATFLPQCSQENREQSIENRIERDIYKDIEGLIDLGLTEEAQKIADYVRQYSPTMDQYQAIKDAVFDPKVRHLDQYIQKIMKGKQ